MRESRGERWEDILWDKGRMMVRASKTARHEDCGVRAVPLFPELMPYLERAFDLAAEGEQYVITRTRDASKNLRTVLLKILAKAGVEPWPRLFQNLRASCETELTDHYPAHVVTAWMGHTVRIAQEHYLSATEEHFRRGAESGAVVVQKAVQTMQRASQPRQTELTEVPSEREVSRILSVVVCHCPSVQISSSGIEPSSFPKLFTAFDASGGAESGAVTALMAALASLPEADRLVLVSWLAGNTEVNTVRHAA